MFYAHANLTSQPITCTNTNPNKKTQTSGPKFITLTLNLQVASKVRLFSGLVLGLGLGIFDVAMCIIQCVRNDVHSWITLSKTLLMWYL